LEFKGKKKVSFAGRFSFPVYKTIVIYHVPPVLSIEKQREFSMFIDKKKG